MSGPNADLQSTVVLPFVPVLEPDVPGAFLTQYPKEAMPGVDVPLLTGYNAQEGLVLFRRKYTNCLTFEKTMFLSKYFYEVGKWMEQILMFDIYLPNLILSGLLWMTMIHAENYGHVEIIYSILDKPKKRRYYVLYLLK